MANVDRKSPGSTGVVYDALWTRFLNGTYTSGDRLPEAALAEELGVSRTPVREALGRMLAEGLVIPAARGVVVAGLDRDALRQLFAFRGNLEGFSTELAAQRASQGLIAPAWFRELKESAQQFASAVAEGDRVSATESNMHFHTLIVEASGNEFVVDAHRRTIARLAVSTSLNLEQADWAREAARQHGLIADALQEGDATEAQRLAEAHIRDAMRVFDRN